MQATKITVAASIGAGAQKVWDFYTQPDHITKWNFASNDWICPKAENDLRVGGKLRSRMEAKDGSFGFDFEATYDKIVDQKEIVYTIADGRQVLAEFDNNDGSTEIQVTFDAEHTHPVEMQRDGWQALLNNFKKYVEAH